MERGLKVFSLLLLILLVLCSFTSVYAGETNDISDVMAQSNINGDIIELNSNDIREDKYLSDNNTVDDEALQESNILDEKNLLESGSSNEDLGEETPTKSFRDLYVDIATHPNNFTLTSNYTYNASIDGFFNVNSIIFDNYVLDGQGFTIDAANSARFL